MSQVTTVSIVNEMQSLIEEVKGNKTIDIEKKVKLMTSITDRQLRAGALSLQWARSIARLPENAIELVPQLNAPGTSAPTQPPKQ